MQTAPFKTARNQRHQVMNTTLAILKQAEAHFQLEQCENGHSLEKTERMIVWASTNSLLNNYCQRENDSICAKKVNGFSEKKRKLKTLIKVQGNVRHIH